jgi:hypothetical protein
LVDFVAPIVDPVAAAAIRGEPGDDTEDAQEGVDDEPDESDDAFAGSAHATPYPLATDAPMPRATANPPTRPTYAAEFVMAASPVTVTLAMPPVTVGGVCSGP